MLLPRFSLRTTLIGVTVSALFFLIAGQALRGHSWAIVITVGVVGLLTTFVFHAGLYALTSALSRIVGTQETPALTSQGGLQANSDQQLPPELEDPSS